MQAALFTGPKKISVTDFITPKPAPDEILLRVGACGVCGTDFHIFEGSAPAKSPVILGHEYTGEIVDKGENVKDLKIGQRVAVNPNIHCGYCEFCLKGKINLCLNLKALGVTLNGGFSEFSAVPRTQVHLLPENFPYSISAFSEPLSCCVHGIDQANIKTGDTVSIIGAGTIGLLMQQLAQLNGAVKTFVYDISPEKREISKQLGADEVLDPEDENAVETLRDKENGGTDIVIECVGSQKASEFALRQVKKGGTLVIFGLADPRAFINLYLQAFFHKELTIKSSILNPNTFQRAVDLLVTGKIRTDLLSPYMINLRNDEINRLFSNERNSAIIKYMVTPES